MNFLSKNIIIILFSVTFLPVLVFAQYQDTLFVFGFVSEGQFNLESIEQRVLDQNDIQVFTHGSYQVKLLKGKNVIASNFFEVEENPEMRVEIQNRKQEEFFRSDRSFFDIKLLLNQDLDVANGTIEIWKGKDLLYSKKLSELPVEVLTAESFAVTDQKDYPDLSYLFHLYYDNGQLLADRDFEFNYDVVPEEFLPETITIPFPYKGEVVNLLGQVAETFQFDPRGGSSNFLKGKISVKAPYVPDAQKVVFYDVQGRTLVTIFVSESSFCNDDGVCNSDRGEDEITCPNDCRGLPTTNNQQPTTDGRGLSGTVWTLIISALAVLGGGGWYVWRKWKETKKLRNLAAETQSWKK